MNTLSFGKRIMAVTSGALLVGASLTFAPGALAADHLSELQTAAEKVPFTLYNPTFTASLPLAKVTLGKFRDAGPNPGGCTYFVTSEFGKVKNPALVITQSEACDDPLEPQLVVATFNVKFAGAKRQKVTITTFCPNENAVGDSDCRRGSTATPRQVLRQSMGETWVVLPAKGEAAETTTAQIVTGGLTVRQIQRIVRSLTSVGSNMTKGDK
ncbi:MAG: hypothetical protein O2943_02545 [Actinomycetota bacterium]|nr:hypothetical protein [Actinomycetota bacterium]